MPRTMPPKDPKTGKFLKGGAKAKTNPKGPSPKGKGLPAQAGPKPTKGKTKAPAKKENPWALNEPPPRKQDKKVSKDELIAELSQKLSVMELKELLAKL